MGGKIPESCYLKGTDLVDKKDVISLRVSAARCSDVEYSVTQANVVLK